MTCQRQAARGDICPTTLLEVCIEDQYSSDRSAGLVLATLARSAPLTSSATDAFASTLSGTVLAYNVSGEPASAQSDTFNLWNYLPVSKLALLASLNCPVAAFVSLHLLHSVYLSIPALWKSAKQARLPSKVLALIQSRCGWGHWLLQQLQASPAYQQNAVEADACIMCFTCTCMGALNSESKR